MKPWDHLLIAVYILVIAWVFNANWNLQVRSAELKVTEDNRYLLEVLYTKNPFQALVNRNSLILAISNNQATEWARVINAKESN
jgi:hypothetical protein